VGQATGGGSVIGHGLGRCQIGPANTIIVNRSSTTPNLQLTGKVYDVGVTDNLIERDGGASSEAVVRIGDDGVTAPTNVIARGNRVLQYSGIAPGIDLSGSTRWTARENSISYHAATADSGATGFVGLYCATSSIGVCSGVAGQNLVKVGDQNIKASLDLATKTTHVDTVVEARYPGVAGNSITVNFIAGASTNAGSLVDGTNTVTIAYRSGGTTVAMVEALIANSTQIEVKTSGTQANVLASPADSFSATALAGAALGGRMLAGVEILKGGGSTVGRLTLRDNFVSNARTQMYLDADGASAWPEGYPVISGNQSVTVTNEFEGGITTYRTETTAAAETIASGALSPVLTTTFVTTANTVAYTLADGVADGFRKCEKIKSTSGTPHGTLTPTHFADGTTHTITWSAAGGFACETWDATGGTWRLTGSSGVTIN
jgi:hypothetical protein